MRQNLVGHSLLTLCLLGGVAWAAPAGPGNGAELAQLCAREAEPCAKFIANIAAASGDDKTICLPDGYRPDHLRQAYIEWAAASDQDLLAREPADRAVLAAFKELYSCDE